MPCLSPAPTSICRENLYFSINTASPKAALASLTALFIVIQTPIPFLQCAYPRRLLMLYEMDSLFRWQFFAMEIFSMAYQYPHHRDIVLFNTFFGSQLRAHYPHCFGIRANKINSSSLVQSHILTKETITWMNAIYFMCKFVILSPNLNMTGEAGKQTASSANNTWRISSASEKQPPI